MAVGWQEKDSWEIHVAKNNHNLEKIVSSFLLPCLILFPGVYISSVFFPSPPHTHTHTTKYQKLSNHCPNTECI